MAPKNTRTREIPGQTVADSKDYESIKKVEVKRRTCVKKCEETVTKTLQKRKPFQDWKTLKKSE